MITCTLAATGAWNLVARDVLLTPAQKEADRFREEVRRRIDGMPR